MKKGWKTFWIVCLVTFCLGIGLCAAGFALGATWEMVGAHTPDWISFGSGADFEVAIGSTKKQESTGNALEKRFTGINNIEVEAEIIELQILTTEDDDGMLVAADDEDLWGKIECYKEGDELVIETKDTFKFDEVSGTVWLYIPETKLGEVDIDIKAGTVFIESIEANHLAVNVDAGEAVVERFQAGESEFKCGAGRIYACGDAMREVEAECGAGEVTLDINGKKEDYNYDIECGIGEVVIGDETHSGIGSTERRSNGASKEMSIECGIGSITVGFEE